MRIKLNAPTVHPSVKSWAIRTGVWAKTHPTMVINIIGLAMLFGLILGMFIYLVNKPIDVLKDWTIQTTLQPAKGKPVYHPNESLEFISKSTKLVSADGITTRILDCDAVGTAGAREIQLDQLLANRAPGEMASRENSIIVPDVVKFNGLPRVCRLVINVCYNNVILWRDHCETAHSNDFIIEESKLDPVKVQEQIKGLQNQIKDLEEKLVSMRNEPNVTNNVTYVSPQEEESTPTPQAAAPQTNNPPANPEPTPAKNFIQRALDNVSGLLKKWGL